MFDREFYPTPREVIEMMDIQPFGKVVLEPSAGKGDIVDWLKEWGAKDVIACEKHKDLNAILQRKCQIIGDDFFQITAEQVSHIQMIVMNPPFSNAEKHITHAWEIAPEGCEIIALCNYETVSNNHSRYRKNLRQLVTDYGEAKNLGDVFTYAERKTGVEIGLVRLFKPAVGSGFDFDGFYFIDDEQAGGDGLLPYNEVRAVVNSYVAAVRCFDEFRGIADKMNNFTAMTGFGGGFSFHVGHNEQVTTKEAFAKAMQKYCWNYVFKRMGADKYVTKGVKEDINKFVEQRQNYPFTMRNIYRMIEILIGTRTSIMERAIVEAIDRFTMHTHENRYMVEGWKTNAGHMLTKKFITGWISEPNYSHGLGIKAYQGNFEYVLDLTKALCYITATNFDNIPPISQSSVPKDKYGYPVALDYYTREELQRNPDGTFIQSHSGLRWKNENQFSPNLWYEWGFFEFKVFKKGSGHFKFKDDKVWELLNRRYAEIKGQVLPEKL